MPPPNFFKSENKFLQTSRSAAKKFTNRRNFARRMGITAAEIFGKFGSKFVGGQNGDVAKHAAANFGARAKKNRHRNCDGRGDQNYFLKNKKNFAKFYFKKNCGKKIAEKSKNFLENKNLKIEKICENLEIFFCKI